MVRFNKKKVTESVNKVLPTISVGIGVTNLALNQKRIKQDREFHESQTEATRKLAESLDKVVDNTSVSRDANKYRKITRNGKGYKEYELGDISGNIVAKFRKKRKRNDKV